MVKKSKRKQDIRSKLMAAVAMLMVATIMMVSSTYAWFTLSTAPEVQGITTTVGSNGSLEIALSPASGNGSDVADATLTTGTDWAAKNLTWGNLLDLSSESYNLANLTLLPSQLVAAEGATDGTYVLGAQPLATPNYGADGRIEGLLKNAILGGLKDGAVGYYGDGGYGIRAIGTASQMTQQAMVYKTNVSNIKTYANKASNAASKSLNDNGSALASILVQRASETGGSYAEYVENLKALTADMNDAMVNLTEMLRSGLLVAITPISDTNTFNTLRQQIETAVTIDQTLLDAITTAGGTLPNGFTEAAAKVAALQVKISAAKQAADDLDAEGTVTWTEIEPIMNNLMNADGDITVGGKTLSEINENKNELQYLLDLATNCVIVLGPNSGAYYDIAEISGNVTAKVTATLTGTFDGKSQTVEIKDAVIKTNYTGDTAADTMYAGCANITAAGGTASAMIDVNYGYAVDFMFRTNASGSYLLLQTEGAQRVYDNSENPATLGKGSVFTFTTTNASNVDSIERLCESINVVFFDPAAGTIYGIAGATDVSSAEAAGVYTITATLELCAYSVDASGYVTVGDSSGTNILTALGQNQAKGVSAMVYLDGNNVTNADVLNDENVSGTLNLQFASSVDLLPMENTALMNAGTTPKYDAVVMVNTIEAKRVEDAVTGGEAYSADLDNLLSTEQLAQLEGATITVTMGGTEVPGAYDSTEHTISVPAANGEIVVTIIPAP
ncbi:MAG: hypothetical protein IJX37_05740 [Oscillospiraceae bacterium]|nr:hypothetical protein [Oscillospiraceae bacterium]